MYHSTALIYITQTCVYIEYPPRQAHSLTILDIKTNLIRSGLVVHYILYFDPLFHIFPTADNSGSYIKLHGGWITTCKRGSFWILGIWNRCMHLNT